LHFSDTFYFFLQQKKQEKINYTHWYKTGTTLSDTLFSVYIPDCFTPNGDGLNDIFIPKGEYVLNLMEIKNRNSNNMFQSNDKNKGWDGRVAASSETVTSGHYTFKLFIYDKYETEQEFVGRVLLLK